MLFIWLGFIFFVLVMLALDLGVFHREAHVVSTREALGWSAVWILLALLFTVFIYLGYEHQWLGLGQRIDPVDGAINGGRAASIKYLTGYLIEKSLSVDNIFVIAMLFSSFAVPVIYQHRVLFWGILGALAMRGVMIGVGGELIARAHWVLYLFGAFLIITAVKMMLIKEHQTDPQRNIVVRMVRHFFPVTQQYHGTHFLVRAGSVQASEPPVPGQSAPQADPAVALARPGQWMLTPLGIALASIETTDLIFAADSIPAIFAITADPFLVFTSNVFAVLGLRSLYFALAGMMHRFKFLKVSLALILALVGVKMLIAPWLKTFLGQHFNLYLLGTVLLILAGGVLASMINNKLTAAPARAA